MNIHKYTNYYIIEIHMNIRKYTNYYIIEIHMNIHKYTNYYIIEIHINRLITTTQIFIAMDYFIMISEKYLYFRKRKKTKLLSFAAVCTNKKIETMKP